MNPINESDGNGSIIDAKKMGAVWGVVIPLLLIAVTVYSICIREQANSTDMNGTLSMIFLKIVQAAHCRTSCNACSKRFAPIAVPIALSNLPNDIVAYFPYVIPT